MKQPTKEQLPPDECDHEHAEYETWLSDFTDEAVDVEVLVCPCGMWYDEREEAWTIE